MILVNHLMKILNVRISYETIRRYAINRNPVLLQKINNNLDYLIRQRWVASLFGLDNLKWLHLTQRFSLNARCRSFGQFSKMSDDSDVFNGTLDRYNGITIDTDIAAIDLNQFAEQLESKWKWKFTSKITAKTYSTWLFFITFAERIGCLLQSLCNIGKRMRIGPFGLRWISTMPASFRFSLR